jgi:membrane-bound serine protease (ClpP class)
MNSPLFWTFSFLAAAILAAAADIFLPSGGVFAAAAVLFLIVSIVFSFQISILFGSIYLNVVICLLVPLFLWAAILLYPKTWIGRKILLNPADDPALVPDGELQALKELAGKEGTAKSKMLLGGMIEVDGKQYNAVSDAEPVEAGERIRVLRIEGRSIIVRKEMPAAGETPAAIPEIDDPFSDNGSSVPPAGS